MEKIDIGKSILNKRREMGLTQEELAAHIGVTKASVSKWEKGQSYPDITLLPRLAAYFGISVDALIGYTPQMSKDDIRRLYQRLAADFSAKPFGEVLEEVRQLCNEYYSCHPLLLQLAILLVNHYVLAPSEEERTSVLEETLALCRRIKAACGDVFLVQQARSIEATICLMLQRPLDVIGLLQDAALHPFSQDEMILSSAYEMQGDVRAAKKVLQVSSYQYVLFLIGAAVKLLPLYKDERGRFEEILRRALAVAQAFGVETLHPNAYIQLTLTAAFCLAPLGDCERALDFLGKSMDAFEGFGLPVMLRGDAYFDLLGEWFEDFDLGANAPQDPKLIQKSFWQMLHHPALSPLFELSAYKSILARAEKVIGDVK